MRYLCPLKMRKGCYFIGEEINEYKGIERALIDGNIKLFESEKRKYRLKLIKSGLYFLIDSLRAIVVRNLLKKISSFIED